MSSSKKSSSGDSAWTLAAMEFAFSQSGNKSESPGQAAKVLPSLILERISSGAVRRIPEKEILDRKLKELQTERLSLFLQLSKENQSRDALVLTAENKKKLQKLIKEENEKISGIEDKIRENLDAAGNEIQKSLAKIKAVEIQKNDSDPEPPEDFDEIKNPEEKKSSPGKSGGEPSQEEKKKFFNPFALPFFHRGEENDIIEENVAVYKSDPNSLFKPSAKALEEGFSSWNFESEVAAQKINGLLSGKIISYGDYCSVTVEIRSYPGAKVSGTVTEVGMLGDLIPLASRIASGLSPKISNTLPVRIEFDVSPAQASDSLVVTVDGVVQQLLSKSRSGNDAENSILVNAGIHRIMIESAGYEPLSVLYSFSDESVFTVKAGLVPAVENDIHIRLKKYRDGIFYADALDSSKVSPENPYGTLTVNGKPSLAVFKAAPQKSVSGLLENSSVGSDDSDDSQIAAAGSSAEPSVSPPEDKDGKKKQEKKKSRSGKLEPKEESNIAFIQIPAAQKNSAFDGAYLFADAKPYDRAADIDHRRRMMYLAYTGLICSLPWTFYNIGNFTSEKKAYLNNRASYDNLIEWQNKSYISLGVTAVFGAWTVFELVRYLYAADKVLPAKAKIDKKSAEILQGQEINHKSQDNLNFDSDDRNLENKDGENNGENIVCTETEEPFQIEQD